tara:strand:+ start:3937 stop:4137 length:201 start_codon:yes stop_codon:yes gene_type:complete
MLKEQLIYVIGVICSIALILCCFYGKVEDYLTFTEALTGIVLFSCTTALFIWAIYEEYKLYKKFHE